MAESSEPTPGLEKPFGTRVGQPTPKSTETRKLLRQFQAGVREFEKDWKATDAYRAAQKAKKAKAKKKKSAK